MLRLPWAFSLYAARVVHAACNMAMIAAVFFHYTG